MFHSVILGIRFGRKLGESTNTGTLKFAETSLRPLYLTGLIESKYLDTIFYRIYLTINQFVTLLMQETADDFEILQ